MLSTSDVAYQLVAFCRAGKFIEAQMELMAPDCEQIEPQQAVVHSVQGLTAILEKEKRFQAAIIDMHKTTISDPIIAGNFFSISLDFDMTLQNRGRVQLTEIGLYEVRNGKIVREQFFY